MIQEKMQILGVQGRHARGSREIYIFLRVLWDLKHVPDNYFCLKVECPGGSIFTICRWHSTKRRGFSRMKI